MAWRVKRLGLFGSGTSRTITLGEFFDALEQNGLPQATGTYWRYVDGKKGDSTDFKVGEACALGQAALNLGMDYSDMSTTLYRFKNSKGRSLDDSIINRNDGNHWSIKRIARFYRKQYADRLNEKFDIRVRYSVEKE